jgi:alkylation response protein AidB-like acyl-CoA dehydrogenase
MNFDLSDDQRALVDTVQRFARSAAAKRQIASPVGAASEAAVLRWEQMGELGVAALLIGENNGGMGLGAVEAVLVSEALGQSLAQEPFVTAGVLAPKLLELSTSNDLMVKYLPGVAEGRVRIALASDESVHEFDLSSVATRAEDRSDRIVVTGRKELVVDGAMATHFAVTARDANGLNVFLVAAGQSGVMVTPMRGLDGGWMARIELECVEAEGPLFREAAGLGSLECAVDHATVAICGEALGLMNRMIALTASYLQTRHQFGKAIGTFQALQHRFADMVTLAEQARSGTLMAAAALASEDTEARKADVSAAKSLVGRHGRAVLEGAIQLHGGIGITDEFELSRYVRRMIEIEKTWGDVSYHEARFARVTEAR